MHHVTRSATQQTVSLFQDWVKSLAQKPMELLTPADVVAFEKQLRNAGLQMIGSMFGPIFLILRMPQDRTARECNLAESHTRYLSSS